MDKKVLELISLKAQHNNFNCGDGNATLTDSKEENLWIKLKKDHKSQFYVNENPCNQPIFKGKSMKNKSVDWNPIENDFIDEKP